MNSGQRGFYTLVGWVTWKGAKWYLARRLGLRRKRRLARNAGLAALGLAAGGGAFALVRSRTRGA